MKILYENYLDDSIITATSESTQFPATNLYHNFLLKKFQSPTSSAEISVLFPEDRTVSMIAYAFNNLDTATGVLEIDPLASDTFEIDPLASDVFQISLESKIVLKDSTGAVLETVELETGSYMSVIYTDPIVCREIVISFSSAETEVYVGGLSVGDPLEYENIQINPQFPIGLRSAVEKTNGGQLIGNKQPNLRSWDIVIPDADNTKRAETKLMLDTVGAFKPFFADLYPGYSDIEDPMYCSIVSISPPRKDSRAGDYSFGLVLEECK